MRVKTLVSDLTANARTFIQKNWPAVKCWALGSPALGRLSLLGDFQQGSKFYHSRKPIRKIGKMIIFYRHICSAEGFKVKLIAQTEMKTLSLVSRVP